jgi:hydrogenase maturation protease
MGDDGVGIKVVASLKKEGSGIPDGIGILDAGVCGLDILNLLEGVDKVIIVDSVVGGGSDTKKGSILRFELEDLLDADHEHAGIFSAHDIGITDILNIAKHVQPLPEIIFFGIDIGEVRQEMSMGLSLEVLDAIDRVIASIVKEVASEVAITS